MGKKFDMKNENALETQAVALVQDILDCAVAAGADRVDLERVPEGLEIL